MSDHSNRGKWAEPEFSKSELGDDRLRKRLIQIAERLSEFPESSMNQACGTWAETKAAYRFFQNDRVDVESILNSHRERVSDRAKKESTILVAQDTSYFLYSHHPSTQGMGRINGFKSKSTSKVPRTSRIVMHPHWP